MSTRVFESVSHAKVYAKLRPSPPTELINAILKYVSTEIPRNEWKIAADTGCGSGQNTKVIAPHFDMVYGFDISDAQIHEANNANELKNVIYKTSPSESLPLETNSCQLITASQSAHWYDIDKYFVEAKRVLTRNGVLALFGYKTPQISHSKFSNDSRLTNFMDTCFNSPLLSWNKEKLDMVNSGYANIIMPFDDVLRKDFIHMSRASVENLKDFIQTWSGYQTIKEIHPQKAQLFMKNFDDSIKDIFGDAHFDEIELNVRFDFFLLMGRNPKLN